MESYLQRKKGVFGSRIRKDEGLQFALARILANAATSELRNRLQE